jgi:phage terminase large subunit
MREKAKKLFLQGMSPSQIAEELGIPAGTVRGWKSKDKWGKSPGSVPTKRSVPKKRKNVPSAEVKSVMANKQLTDKQRLFCLYYSKSFNATRSYQKAYGADLESAMTAGPRLLQNVRVAEEIMKIKEQRYARAYLQPEDIFQKYMDIAFADISDFTDWRQEEQQIMGPFGPIMIEDPATGIKQPLTKMVNVVRFRDSDQVDGSILSEVKQGRDGASIKLADRMKALDWLTEHMDMATARQQAELDKIRSEIAKNTAETSAAQGGIVIPDAVWRELMNQAYAEQLTAMQPTQIFFGGSSSGKSFAIVGQRTVRDVMTGKRNYLICRKTGRTLRNSCFNEVRKCISRMDLESEFSINKTDLVITHKSSGCQILFAGLDDVEKVKSITPQKGVITDILIEESTEIEYNDYKSLVKRLRGDTGDDSIIKRMIFLFNPILQDHWIYTEFFEGKWDDSKDYYADDKLLIRRTIYKHNRWLTADDISKLEDESDKYYYDVYTLGKWGILGNLIFTNWTIEDQTEHRKRINQFYNGLDFGFFPDPVAYVRCSYDRARKEIRIFLTDGGQNMTNDLIAEKLKPIIGREVISCDNEMKSIQELCNFGINAIPAEKGPGSVLFGIKWLQKQKIFIDPRCVEIIQEMKKYKYREDKNGTVLPEPVDRDNHWIDSLRYSLSHIMVETRVS